MELEDRSRPHPIDEKHSKPRLRYDTEKHINPRTGEVVEGAKSPAEKNPLSYDVQNIEPVAPATVVRRYGLKEQGSSHSSTKDSAYGSMDAKVNGTKSVSLKGENKQMSTIQSTRNSPSRSLSGSSIHQNRSPMSVHAQRIQKSEEVYSKELESSKGSTSTLHTHSSRSNSLQVIRNESLDYSSSANDVPSQAENIGNASRPNNPIITQNGFSPGIKQPQTKSKSKSPSPYISMKSAAYSAYDNVQPVRNTTMVVEQFPQNNTVPDSPYTSMMNIVQGQIKISPHENEINSNVVNVSITPVSNNKKM